MVNGTQNLSREMILPAYKMILRAYKAPSDLGIRISDFGGSSRRFYAKQTQFPKSQNEHKPLFNNGL